MLGGVNIRRDDIGFYFIEARGAFRIGTPDRIGAFEKGIEAVGIANESKCFRRPKYGMIVLRPVLSNARRIVFYVAGVFSGEIVEGRIEEFEDF